MANVPTWRSQAAPSFDAALEAVADANKQQTEGMLQLAKGIGDTSDEYGDIVKNQAYNVLSKAIPKEGQTLAEARKDTREDPDNAELFGSSWLGAKEMDAMEKTLGALDASKQKVKSRSTVMEQVRRLAAVDPLKDPAEAREMMNDFTQFNKLNNISDSDDQLKEYADTLLRNTKVQLNEQTLENAGGILGNERSYTPEVIANVKRTVEDKIRVQNRAASDKEIKAKVTEVLSQSPLGAAFARQTDLYKTKSLIDIEREGLAERVANANATGNNDDLIEAVKYASTWITRHPEASQEDIAFLAEPISRAMDDMDVNLLDIWRKTNGNSTAATQSEQTAFRDALYSTYRAKFPDLPSSIIDQQVARDIQGNTTLRAFINSGNAISEFQTKRMREDYEALNKFHGEQRDLLFKIRKSNLQSVVGQDLEKTLNATFGKKLTGIKRSDLYDQVNLTIKKIKRAFPNLEPHQQATLDIAIYKFITTDGGYDGDGSWIPWDRADFPLMTVDKHSDMSKAKINELLDQLKTYLPDKRDRVAGAQKEGAVLLEERIAAIMEKNPLPENFGQGNVDSRTKKAMKQKSWLSRFNLNKPQLTREQIAEQYKEEMGKGLSWKNPESWWPWFKEKAGNSEEAKILGRLIGAQKIDQAQGTPSRVQPQNKYNPK